MKDIVFKIDFDLAKQVAENINKENGLYTLYFDDFKKLIGFTGSAEIFEHMNVNVSRKFNQFSNVCPDGMMFKIGKKDSMIYFSFVSDEQYNKRLISKKHEIINLLKHEQYGMNKTEIQKMVGQSYLTREALQHLLESQRVYEVENKYYLNVD